MRTRTYDELHEDAYKHLIENGNISCGYRAFTDAVDVYQTPHGVYIDLYSGMSQEMEDQLTSKLLNVTPDNLKGYKNAVDWLVQKHELVRYLKEIDAYIYFSDSSIVFEDNEATGITN